MPRTIVLVLAALGLASPAVAAPPAAPPPACTAPEFRQFDFWLGDWDVFTPDGKPAGTNRVTRELGDCVIHEHWLGAGGSRGESFNAWDARRGVWHQTWVSDRGGVLLLDGGRDGDRMVLTGRMPDSTATNGAAIQRITWSPAGPGEVRQLWEQSRDGGTTWGVAFDGRYRRRDAR